MPLGESDLSDTILHFDYSIEPNLLGPILVPPIFDNISTPSVLLLFGLIWPLTIN